MDSRNTATSACSELTSGPLGPVTFDDVKKAAQKLAAAGHSVSSRAVRAELGGRGSQTTITRCLRELNQADQLSETPREPVLSPEISRDLAKELDRLAGERTARLVTELTDTRDSLDLVLQESEAFRTAEITANALVTSLRSSLAEQVGAAAAFKGQLEAVSKKLDEQQADSQVAKRELALATEQLRRSEEQRAALEVQAHEGKDQVRRLQQQLADSKNEAEAARRECVGHIAQVAALEKSNNHLQQSLEKAQLLQPQLEAARMKLSAAEAECSGMAARLEDIKQVAHRGDATIQQLLGKLLTHDDPRAGERPT